MDVKVHTKCGQRGVTSTDKHIFDHAFVHTPQTAYAVICRDGMPPYWDMKDAQLNYLVQTMTWLGLLTYFRNPQMNFNRHHSFYPFP